MIDTFYASVVSYACLHLILMNAIDGIFFEGSVWFCNNTAVQNSLGSVCFFFYVFERSIFCTSRRYLFDRKYSQTSNLVKYSYIIISAVKVNNALTQIHFNGTNFINTRLTQHMFSV